MTDYALPLQVCIDGGYQNSAVVHYLEEQQVAWEYVNSTGAVLSLDPPQPIDHQMICDIQAIAGWLASKARQLLGKYSVLAKINNDIVCWVDNFTTNLGEGYVNVRSKFDGGKQVNRGRCAGAGLRINEGSAWGPAMWEITSIPPSTTFAAVANVRVHQAEGKECKANKEVKECQK